MRPTPLAAPLAALLLLLPALTHATPWEPLGDIDGVKTERQTKEDSPLFAFRGELTADIPLDVLAATFADPAQRRHWVDRYAEHITLEKTKLTEIYWIRFSLPPLVSDRDYILNTVAEIDRARGELRAEITSTTHPKAPEGCCVRAEVQRTFYRFSALSRTQTRLIVEVQTDPKGLLPRWLVNQIQKSWPSKTLNGLVKRAREVGSSHPEMRAWLDERFPATP
ncbi:MAG: hypothetical protein FJ138_09255 [Deltaproteobacteria bacterium]|nr:hypothetical protein [Deltaproteobacteria bacterium]